MSKDDRDELGKKVDSLEKAVKGQRVHLALRILLNRQPEIAVEHCVGVLKERRDGVEDDVGIGSCEWFRSALLYVTNGNVNSRRPALRSETMRPNKIGTQTFTNRLRSMSPTQTRARTCNEKDLLGHR